MTPKPPVVHVIDDDAPFRTATARLLRVSGYLASVYASADEFLNSSLDPGPGCILLDVNMPKVSGLELQDRLQNLEVILPIVFLSGHGDIPTSVRAIKAGAEDFLTKPVTKEDLLGAIVRALKRFELASKHASRLAAAKSTLGRLTAREQQVFALLIRGKPHKQIAFDLGTAERTVKAHRHKIMEKLQVRSLAEAVLIAERLGMFEEGAKETSK